MTNHTPTPWKIDEYEQVRKDCENILVSGFALTTGSHKPSRELGRANAAHIVKCVNLHDELVAACRDLVVCVECADYSPTHQEYVLQAKSLLAKAEGASDEPIDEVISESALVSLRKLAARIRMDASPGFGGDLDIQCCDSLPALEGAIQLLESQQERLSAATTQVQRTYQSGYHDALDRVRCAISEMRVNEP